MNYGGNLQSQKIADCHREVEQLRIEVEVPRQKVSVSAREIVGFCENEQKMDPFIVKMPDNPFKDKSKLTCVLM